MAFILNIMIYNSVCSYLWFIKNTIWEFWKVFTRKVNHVWLDIHAVTLCDHQRAVKTSISLHLTCQPTAPAALLQTKKNNIHTKNVLWNNIRTANIVFLLATLGQRRKQGCKNSDSSVYLEFCLCPPVDFGCSIRSLLARFASHHSPREMSGSLAAIAPSCALTNC